MGQSEPNNKFILLDKDLAPKISLQEALALKPIQKQFMESYIASRDFLPLDQWLRQEMATQLPDYSADQITQMSAEILSSINLREEKIASIRSTVADGRSKTSWFANEMKKLTADMTPQETADFLHATDDILNQVNEAQLRNIQAQINLTTSDPNLNGFVQEQYHAQTFNANAETIGSPYRAKVLETVTPAAIKDSIGNAVNSDAVNIVITNGKDHIVDRYVPQYCQDTKAVMDAISSGDYHQLADLAPDLLEQVLGKDATTIIDHVTSGDLAQIKSLPSELLEQALGKNAQTVVESLATGDLSQIKDMAPQWVEQTLGKDAKTVLDTVTSGDFSKLTDLAPEWVEQPLGKDAKTVVDALSTGDYGKLTDLAPTWAGQALGLGKDATTVIDAIADGDYQKLKDLAPQLAERTLGKEAKTIVEAISTADLTKVKDLAPQLLEQTLGKEARKTR